MRSLILALLLLAAPAVAQTPLEAFTRIRVNDPGWSPAAANDSTCLHCHERSAREILVGGSGANYQTAFWMRLLPSGLPFQVYRLQAQLQQPTVPFAVSNRSAPTTFGAGLVEQIDDATLIAMSDPSDADGDGISGRPNFVIPYSFRVGRFGWQACAVDLPSMVRLALEHEIGITPAEQQANAAFYDADVALLVEFVRSLPAPAPYEPAGLAAQIANGEEVFAEVGCADCHTQNIELPDSTVIHPLSDFLLHDMGRGLDDGIGLCGATSKEWRTAPLWQRRLQLLHDGRIGNNVFNDVMRWHGGESAASAAAYLAIANTNDGRDLKLYVETR